MVMTEVCSDVLVIVSPYNSMYPSLMHANFCVCQSPFYRNQLLFAKKYKAFLLFFVCSFVLRKSIWKSTGGLVDSVYFGV